MTRILYVECRDGRPMLNEEGFGYCCETLTAVYEAGESADIWLPYVPAAELDAIRESYANTAMGQVMLDRDTAIARAEAAETALKERESDMHMRIRADYDTAVADSWRAKLDAAEAELESAEGLIECLRADRDGFYSERNKAIERANQAEARVREMEARAKNAEAAARVLAHAWDHDSNPPDWAVEAGRSYPL